MTSLHRPTVYIFSDHTPPNLRWLGDRQQFAKESGGGARLGRQLHGRLPDCQIASARKHLPDMFKYAGYYFASPDALKLITDESQNNVQIIDVNIMDTNGESIGYKVISPLAWHDVVDLQRSRLTIKVYGEIALYTNVRKIRFKDEANDLNGVFCVKGLYSLCASQTFFEKWKKLSLKGGGWDSAIDYFNGILDVQGIAHDNSD